MDVKEYADICENANDLIQSITPDGHFRYVNKAWLKTLGYHMDELKDLTVFNVVHPDELKHCQELFMKVMSGDDIGVITTTFVTSSGENVFVEGNVNCHFINGSPAYTRAIFRDITKLKKAERMIEQLYNQEKKLRKSLEDEIEKRAEFARILVHELKTPLTSIYAVAELLQESELQPPYDRAVDTMYRSSYELNERIGELLQLTKAEVGDLQLELKQIDPSNMISEIANDVELIVSEKNLNFDVQVPSSLPYVNADIKRIRQVIQNLITNAVRATPEGGKIILRAKEQDSNILIQVQDTGRGIKRKDQKLIFEPYYRIPGVADDYKGFGLGLALSKKIVEAHGGRIWVESKEGQGSTFTFSIPTFVLCHTYLDLPSCVV